MLFWSKVEQYSILTKWRSLSCFGQIVVVLVQGTLVIIGMENSLKNFVEEFIEKKQVQEFPHLYIVGTLQTTKTNKQGPTGPSSRPSTQHCPTPSSRSLKASTRRISSSSSPLVTQQASKVIAEAERGTLQDRSGPAGK